MKKSALDLKKGIAKLKVENLDDLWYLSQIIDPGDLITGKTERKIKLGTNDDRSGKSVRKIIILEIEVEKIEFTEDSLRLNGKVTEGKDDIASGSYHSVNITLEDNLVTIKKKKWLSFQINKLNEAINTNSPKILILVMDRENAIFALNNKSNYKILAEINGDVSKKIDGVNTKGNFYVDLEKALFEYKAKAEHVIVASPAFFKEDFVKGIKDSKLKKSITLATCSSVTNNAINEVLKRQEVQHVLKQDIISKETKLVDEVMQRISKDNLAAYGIREVKKAIEMGAVKILLISDSKVKKMREMGKYHELENLMQIVDSSKGEVHLISTIHDAGKQLHGLGGIAAVLRYKI